VDKTNYFQLLYFNANIILAQNFPSTM